MSNKPKFDPSQPFEAVKDKPKFDPSQPYEAVEAKPSSSDGLKEKVLELSQKYEIPADVLEQHAVRAGATYDDSSDFEKGYATAYRAGDNILMNLPSKLARKIEDDKTEMAVDELRAYIESQRSAGNTVFDVATSMLGPVGAAAGATKLAKAGIGAAMGTAAGYGNSSADSELSGSVLGGLVGGVAPTAVEGAVKGAGKAGALLKKLIPGSEDAAEWVNKTVAKSAKLVPSQGASAEAIEEMLSNAKLRRAARNTDFTDEAMRLADSLESSKKVLNEAVDKRFGELEQLSLKKVAPWKDLDASTDIQRKLGDSINLIATDGQFYSKTPKKLLEDVYEILNAGGPSEAGQATHKLSFADAVEQFSKKDGPDQAVLKGAALLRKRALNARRYVDDLMKNKNWDNLLNHEKEFIKNIRKTLDENLKSVFGGNEERLVADKLYREAQTRMSDLYKPLEQLTPNKTREVNPSKLNNFLKSQGVKGSVFDGRVGEFRKFLKEAEAQLGKMPEVQQVLDDLEKVRETGAMQRMLDDMTRAGGGPTSQAVNLALQAVGAGISGGYSLLLLPITNPRGWVEMVDGIGKPLHDSITKIANKLINTNPALVAKLYAISQQSEDQDE